MKHLKQLSTFDRIMQNPARKKEFDKGYEEFLLNEFLLEAMEEKHISVRKLAQEPGVSPTIIQSIRSGKTSNITLKKLSSIIATLGYKISFQKIGYEK